MYVLHKELNLFVAVVEENHTHYRILHPKTGKTLVSPKSNFQVLSEDPEVSDNLELLHRIAYKLHHPYRIWTQDTCGTKYSAYLSEGEYRGLLNGTKALLIYRERGIVYILYKKDVDFFLDEVHSRRLQRKLLEKWEDCTLNHAYRDFAMKKKGGAWTFGVLGN